ncbi:MAG: MATE family efflux transporter [Corynebacterium sp.]|nr:MATE family efflux transporter [Corynebacterium sp.]
MSVHNAAHPDNVNARSILRLALPALGVLAAMPLYLLLDTAVVGRLGSQELAALGAAATIQSVVTTQLTFLSYGTTSRAARHFGAGRRAEAVGEGLQATYVAIGVGMVLAIGMWSGADTLAMWMTGNAQTAALTAQWLKVAALAIPVALTIMAGNGWLRGVQDTVKTLRFTLSGVIPGAIAIPFFVSWWGLVGSAWANVLGMSIVSALFLSELFVQHKGSWKVDFGIIGKQLLLGRDLIVRSLSFQVTFVSAAAVAARFGTSALAAHQVMLQLWNFLVLALDALAIAAQTLVGAALGGGSIKNARETGKKIVGYSTVFALVLAVVLAGGAAIIPRIFTADESVHAQMHIPWWIMVGLVIVGGVLFALDGVLLGAGDAAFLRTVTVVSALLGFLPGIWLAYFFGWGLPGVWTGLAVFICARAAAGYLRFNSMKWAIVG